MFNIRDLSNTAIILIMIAAFMGVVTVRALTFSATVTPAEKYVRTEQLDIDPNLAFNMLPNDVHVRVGDTFHVTVSVINATNMYGWQIYVIYDPAMLECLRVSLPPGYLLSSYVTVSGALAIYDGKEWPSGEPLQRIRNDVGWVLAGDCQLGVDQPTFNGSGTLCQIDFKALSPGSSPLALLHDFDHDFQTYVLNPDIMAVTAPSASYSNVYVTSP